MAVAVGTGAGISNTASGFSKICRTCAACTDCLMPIFSGEGLLNNLADKIQRHLPIQVSEWDRLPQQLCQQCANTLLAWHELVKCCTQADAALRVRLQRLQQLSQQENVATTSRGSSATEKLPSEQTDQNYKLNEDKKIDFGKYLESILLSYIDVPTQSQTSPNVNNIIYVCQKCDKYSPFQTVELLALHLQEAHIHEIPDEASITHFVTENLILVETLDESLPDKNLIIKPEVNLEPNVKVEVNNVTSMRIWKQPKPSEDLLEKLCCPFCQKIFSSSRRLIVHLNVHSEVSVSAADGFGCRCCSFACRDAASLVSHLQKEHVVMEMEGSQQLCRSCGHIADTKTDLQRHVAVFHTPEQKHKQERPSVARTNPKYIPVECPVCGRRVSNKYNLAGHMKQHAQEPTSIDKFQCSECGKSYRSRGSLKWHENTVHRGVLRYVCADCGEAFPSKMYRDIHARVHTGETPFTCDLCGKQFRSKNSLVAHVKCHLGVRDYACTRCPSKFQKLAHLKYHLTSHEKKDKKLKDNLINTVQ